MKHIVIALLLMMSLSYATEPSKYIIKVARVSSTEAAVSCRNGADPTGMKIGDTLIISCGLALAADLKAEPRKN